MRYFIVGLVLLLPATSQAAVIISEVAWMGSSASANHEWIELYNDGGAVDVSNWTFTDGMNFNITLSGTIPTQSYAVLERSSEASAPGTAFYIYTGALVNTGATMQLKRSDSSLEDQVAGGENWQSIGGDNVTKETAQYTAAGWVTGAATPGASNKGSVKPPADNPKEDDDSDSESESPIVRPKTTSGETIKLILPGVNLKVAISAQKVGYVNQSIEFTPTASGVGDTIIDSLIYQWNFGDGTTAFTKEPTHSFQYPGTYIVTTYATYKRQEQVARHEITILPVSLSLTSAPDGSVQLNNDSPYEIDISGYKLTASKEFIFPDYSLLLPNQTVTISRAKIGAGPATIKDKVGVVVLASKKSSGDTLTVPTASIEKSPARLSAKQLEKTEVWHPPLLAPEDSKASLIGAIKKYLSPDTVTAQDATLFGSSTSIKNNTIPHSAWPYLGLIGVIILGLFGTARKLTSNQTN